METNPTCPKCSSAMEEGFMPDIGEGPALTRWHPGEPVPIRFLGSNMGIFKVNLKQLRPVVTYRCTQCGYLESYAP